MSKYDLALRLRRVVDNECEISRDETNIAKKISKYCKETSILKTMLAKQEEDVAKYRKKLKVIIYENDKLDKLKQREESRLCVLLKDLEHLEEEFLQTQQKQIKQRRTKLLKRDCLGSIKQATQVYINLNALPKVVQGVIINETDSSSEWKAFRIVPSEHTQKEVENIIWSSSEKDSILKRTWETLIFPDDLVAKLTYPN